MPRTATAPPTNPDHWSASRWSGRLGQLRRQGRADDDPDVVQCERALDYVRCIDTLNDSRRSLGDAAVDSLTAALRRRVEELEVTP
ncbi:hypothetical protein [Nocardia sp. 348MFTsu5.1]|uniref:hypothetical protein n=1 Tax=Nocardia sp. 348MFTsu5.1 TaxID=1172185 RepID=UPI00039CD8A5|nr:hypothetical protein [Nocardia sp. 348MFTsu5.1]